MTDEESLIKAHAAYLKAEQERREAIEQALRNRSVPQTKIAEITGLSRETIRIMRRDAGIPADARKVRTK